MIKNKNLNYALIIFAITLSLLFAFVEYYPSDNISEGDIIENNARPDELVITSN